MKKLNLDALITQTHEIEKGGQTYPVRQITATVASLIDAAREASGVEKVRLYYDAVARLVPDLKRDEVDDLTVTQVMAIISFASEAVNAVDEAAADPNASGSAPTATATEPPAPTAT